MTFEFASAARWTLLTLLLFSSACGYPSRAEIDKFFGSEMNKSEGREARVKQLLRRLSSPEGPTDDAALEHALKELAKLYSKTHDAAILAAVDSTKIDAGFANFICGFYYDVRENEGVRSRYRDKKYREGIGRCRGSWFADDEELDKILSGPVRVKTKQKGPARYFNRGGSEE